MGALLFNGNCITCHHVKESSSAPSIVQIREKYRQAFPQKKDFIKYMSEWVLQPKEETSLMHNAIEKYKIMPELAYELGTLEEISEYIYHANFQTTP